jgi:phosphonate transport system permease protein
MSAAWPTTWRRPPTLIRTAHWRWGLVYGGALVYLVLAVGTVEVNWTRVADGWERGCASSAASSSPTSPRAGATSARG